MADDDTAHPFWTFTLDVYGRDGVSQSCIALQDRHGVDVNMLLFCCWTASQGRGPLDAAAVAAVVAVAEPWQQAVVEPLRAVRRRMKPAPASAPEADTDALRRRLLGVEIEGERIAQSMMAATLAAPSAAPWPKSCGPADAVAGLRAYFNALDVTLDEAGRSDLVGVLAGAFPDEARESLVAAVATNPSESG